MTPKAKYYETLANTMIKNFEKRRMEAYYCPTAKEAVEKALSFLPSGAVVAHGGSMTLEETGMMDALRSADIEFLDRAVCKTPEDSRKIITLLHDVCKTYMYEIDYRNKKIYSDTGSKRDEKGRFDWAAVEYYTINDRVPYGHGEKSVMMIEEYIKLQPFERYAIRWHMGFSEPKENWNTLGTAIEKYPVILALHQSDLEATYLLEKDMKSD